MNSTSQQAQELETWWQDKAQAELEPTIVKAIEYGSRDLIEIGQDLILGGYGSDGFDASNEAMCAEIGIWFYLRGKMARAMEAYRQGRKPSDDTLLDIGVYTRMIQRVRDTGGWPGPVEREPEREQRPEQALLHCGKLYPHGAHEYNRPDPVGEAPWEVWATCPGSPPSTISTRNVQGSGK